MITSILSFGSITSKVVLEAMFIISEYIWVLCFMSSKTIYQTSQQLATISSIETNSNTSQIIARNHF